jgi:hypothetical protein
MSTDRKQRLLMHANAQAAANNPLLPQNLRDLARQSANHGEVALGLQEAAARKAAKQAHQQPQAKPRRA